MQGFASKFFGRIRMTTMIAATVVAGVVLSVGAVCVAVYINLSANSDNVAIATQKSISAPPRPFWAAWAASRSNGPKTGCGLDRHLGDAAVL